MKVQILQGINLENSMTTIKIEMDAKPVTTVLELVQSFHPLFMKQFDIKGNTLNIQSKLPHLWKESAQMLNKQATGDATEQEAQEYILGYVIKKQILSMSTIPTLHEAHKQGYETTQFYVEEGFFDGFFGSNKYNRYYCIGAGQESAIAISAASSGDAYTAQNIQRDKWLTNTILERLKLPIAKWELIEDKKDIDLLFDKYEKPLVIKPVGLVGGSGVSVNINSKEDAHKAYDYAKEVIDAKDRKDWQRKIMIQEQVPGDNDYRLLVIDGKFRIATKRIPAYITGDGVSNIEELIEETNKDPRRNLLNPAHTMKPIIIDNFLHDLLKEKNRTLKSVPKKDEIFPVRKVANMSQGGVTEDFTDQVHPQIKLMVETMARSMHAYVLGADIICSDISKPLDGRNGSIIECNTMPEAYLNAFPTYGKQYPEYGEWILNGLVKQTEKTKRIVVIGNGRGSINTTVKPHLNNPTSETIGMYSTNTIYINDQEIRTNIDTWRAIEALKLNASLSTIVLHYTDLSEVEDYGLGFDVIDKLFIHKDIKIPMEKIEQYKKDGLIGEIISF